MKKYKLLANIPLWCYYSSFTLKSTIPLQKLFNISLNRKRFYASTTSYYSYNSFSAPIPSSYIRDSNKPLFVIFSTADLDCFSTFSSKIENCLPINSLYVVYIKLRYYFSNRFINIQPKST